MNTKVLIAILLLLMAISAVYASEDPTEITEYLQKKQQLDQLAERFKAETGFKGDIETNFEHMKLSRFTGNFDDIDMTNVRDSVAFRQVCNTVISKLLPFIGAKSEQLTPERINIRPDYYAVVYKQMVNGYPIENGGALKITYLPSSNQRRFSILDESVDITEQSKGIIAAEEANRIVLHDGADRNHSAVSNNGLRYSCMGSSKHYLAYQVILKSDSNPILDDYIYWINALTGHIMFKRKERLYRS